MNFLTLLLLIHYLIVQHVRPIVQSHPLWIDGLEMEPGSGSV